MSMELFQHSGDTRLLAQEGQRLVALAIAAKFREWFASFRSWQAAMPGTLPPTEFQPR